MGKKKRTAVLDPTELKAVAKTLDKGEGADVKGIKGKLTGVMPRVPARWERHLEQYILYLISQIRS